MTPKDALIEKMARARYDYERDRGWHFTAWDQLTERLRASESAGMRAAYEAEHEEDDAVLRDAVAGGLGMVRVTANEDGEIVTERVAPEQFREHEETKG
jgi:hypothetical protein